MPLPSAPSSVRNVDRRFDGVTYPVGRPVPSARPGSPGRGKTESRSAPPGRGRRRRPVSIVPLPAAHPASRARTAAACPGGPRHRPAVSLAAAAGVKCRFRNARAMSLSGLKKTALAPGRWASGSAAGWLTVATSASTWSVRVACGRQPVHGRPAGGLDGCRQIGGVGVLAQSDQLLVTWRSLPRRGRTPSGRALAGVVHAVTP